MCKGDETRLTECYSLPWGKTTSGDAKNHCVKIECSQLKTCVGKDKITTTRYPYCKCKDGTYEDGINPDCKPCSSKCSTCMFTADNCLECATS